MDDVQVNATLGTYPNPDEIAVEDTPVLLLPCVICNKTFKPEVLQRHSRVCERNVSKKRKPFDSFKQRVKDTDLAEFLPFSALQKRASGSDKPPSPKRTSQWKEKHEEFVSAIRAARGDVPTEGKSSGEPRSILRPSDHERCSYCDRHFGRKAFDRHQEWCREQHSRQPPSAASIQAKERLEARTKYRAPPIKSKRALTREKYSPLVQRKMYHGSPSSNSNNFGSTCSSAGSTSSRQGLTTSVQPPQEPPQKPSRSGNLSQVRTLSKDASALGLSRGGVGRTSLRASQRQPLSSSSSVRQFSGSIKGSSVKVSASPVQSNASMGESHQGNKDDHGSSLSGKKSPLKLLNNRKTKTLDNQKPLGELHACTPALKVRSEQQNHTSNLNRKENMKNNNNPKTEQVWRNSLNTPFSQNTISVPHDSSSPRYNLKSSNQHFHPKINSVFVNQEVSEVIVSQCNSRNLSLHVHDDKKLCFPQDFIHAHSDDNEELGIDSLEGSSVISLGCRSSQETPASSLHSADSHRTYITPSSHINPKDLCAGDSKRRVGSEAFKIKYDYSNFFHHYHVYKRIFVNLCSSRLKANQKLCCISKEFLGGKLSNSYKKKQSHQFLSKIINGSWHFQRSLSLFYYSLQNHCKVSSSMITNTYYFLKSGSASLVAQNDSLKMAENVPLIGCIDQHHAVSQKSLKKIWKTSPTLTTWADVTSGNESLHFIFNLFSKAKSSKEPECLSSSRIMNKNQDFLKFKKLSKPTTSEFLGLKTPPITESVAVQSVSINFCENHQSPSLKMPNLNSFESITDISITKCHPSTSIKQHVYFPKIPNLKSTLEEKTQKLTSFNGKKHKFSLSESIIPTYRLAVSKNSLLERLEPLSSHSKFSGSKNQEPYDPYASAERQMLELLHSDSSPNIGIDVELDPHHTNNDNPKQPSPAPSLSPMLSPTASPKPTPLETSPTSAFTRYSKESELTKEVSALSDNAVQVDRSIQTTKCTNPTQSNPTTQVSIKNIPEEQPLPPPRSFKRSASLQTFKEPADSVLEKDKKNPELKSFRSIDVVVEDNNNLSFDNRPRTYDVESGTRVHKAMPEENQWGNNLIVGSIDIPVLRENAVGGKSEVLQLDSAAEVRNETRESREVREITELEGNHSEIDSLLEEVVRMQRSVSMLSDTDSNNSKQVSVTPVPQSVSSARSRRNRTGKMHIEDFLFPAEMLEQVNNLRGSPDLIGGSSSVFGSTKSRSKNRRLLEHMLFPTADFDINANTDLSHGDDDDVVSPISRLNISTFPIEFDSSTEKTQIVPHPTSPVSLTSKVIDDDDDGLPRPKPVSLSNRSSGAPTNAEAVDKDQISKPTSPTQPPTRSRQSTGSRLSADSAYSSLNRRSPVLQARRQISGAPAPELLSQDVHRNESPQSVLSQSFAQSLALSSSGSESSLPPLTNLHAAKRGRSKQDRDTPSSDIVSASTPLFPKLSKYCHECGTKFSVSLAKFCYECGVRRLELC